MKKPKISFLGEEVKWEDVPEPPATHLNDYFKPVKITAKAIDHASRIVPSDLWIKRGLHSWLQERADHVFQKLPAGKTVGMLGLMRYHFIYDADGPVLSSVSL